MWTQRQAVEIFHLQFLRAFGARIHKDLYALKGGGNLRFFHRSIRFSEDIDLDLHGVSVTTLRNHVDRVLTAPALLQSLRVQQIDLVNYTAPKQTATTQRWKLRLRLGENVEAHTKIDFSRRGLDEGTAYGPIDAEFIQRYRIFPVLAQHYTAEAGFRQKINALASRKNTQARDVFDLKLLMDAGAAKGPLPDWLRQLLPQAIECAIAVGYDTFISQVFAYLEPEHQEHYRQKAVWETLQSQVVEALEALQK